MMEGALSLSSESVAQSKGSFGQNGPYQQRSPISHHYKYYSTRTSTEYFEYNQRRARYCAESIYSTDKSMNPVASRLYSW